MSVANITEKRGYIQGRIASTVSAPIDHPNAVVVLCAPFGIEALASDAVMGYLARTFATAGVLCIQVAPPGHGDSAELAVCPTSGQPELLVDEWLSAIDSALSFARSHAPNVPLCALGLRLGATMVATVASRRGDVDQIVLWAPVSGRAFTRELKMLGASGSVRGEGAAVEGGGFYLGGDDVAAMQTLDIATLHQRPARRVLVIDRDDVRSASKVIDRLNWLGADVEAPAIAGYAAMRLDDPERGELPAAAIVAITSWFDAGECAMPDCALPDCAMPNPQPSVHGNTLCSTMQVTHGGVRIEEEPVRVALTDADSLVGVVSRPAIVVDPTLPAMVILATGSNPACGPGRLHVALARRWSAAGHTVLRLERRHDHVGFDHGLGGAYGDAQVADVKTIARYLRTNLDRDTFVAIGTCSGAWVAFHAAQGIGATPADAQAAQLIGFASLNQIIFDDDTWTTTEESPALAMKARYELTQTLRDPRRWGAIVRGDVPIRPAVHRLGRFVSLRMSAVTKRFRARLTGAEARGPGVMMEQIAASGIAQLYVMDAPETGLGYLRVHAARTLAQLANRHSLRLVVAEGLGHTFGSQHAQQWLINAIDPELQALGIRVGTVAPIPTMGSTTEVVRAGA